MSNPDYDSLLTTTLDNHRDTLTDNLSQNVALYHFLQKSGSVKVGGGNKLVEPLMYAHNTNVKSYSGYEQLDLNPTDEFTAAEYEWSQVAATVIISGIEEAKNSGAEAVINLLDSKMEVAEISLIDEFERQFMGDGTGNSGKDFLGIDALIGDEDSTVTTVGGIDATTEAYWRSYVDRSLDGSGQPDPKALSIEDMTHAFHRASRGREEPKFGLTGLELYEAYNALLQPQQRFTDSKTAEAGFRNLTFQGQPIVWSDYVSDGDLFFINPKFLKLVKLGSNWLRHTKFEGFNDKDARSTKILSYGQLAITNRRLGGSKLENRTP